MPMDNGDDGEIPDEGVVPQVQHDEPQNHEDGGNWIWTVYLLSMNKFIFWKWKNTILIILKCICLKSRSVFALIQY